MSTKTSESRSFRAGNIVFAAQDIYMAGEVLEPTSGEVVIVPKGTVGLIIEESIGSSSYNFRAGLDMSVQFLSGHTRRVSPHEVRLYKIEQSTDV